MKGIFILAFSYIKKQKGRSFSIVVAIALATLISFSNIVQKQTNIKLGTEKLHNTFGTYDYEFNNINNDKVKIIEDDNKDNSIIKTLNLGDIVYKNGVKSILNTYNQNYLGERRFSFLEGRAPENESEIVLEKKAIDEMGLQNKLGKDIDFNINKKYKNDKKEQEYFSENHKFKLVGIVSRENDYYEDFGEYRLRAFVGEGKDLVPSNIITNDGVLNIENETPTVKKIYELGAKYGLTDYEFCMSVGLVQGLNGLGIGEGITKYEIRNIVFPIAVSALLICNILVMTLFDMKKAIGMLRAIGAKKHQIFAIISIQSFLLIVIGLLLGFLLGCGYVYNYISRVYPQNATLYITKEAVLIPILITIITVFISSIIPLYNATKISPIEGMKNNGIANRKFKNRFYYGWIRKIFGITGEMAYKNVFRFRTKSILCILSIGLVGSMYITSLSNYNRSATGIEVLNIGEYDMIMDKYEYNIENPIAMYSKNDIKDIKDIEGVESVDEKLKLDGLMAKNEKYVSVNGYTKEDFKKTYKYIEEKTKEKSSEYIDVLVNNYAVGEEPIDKDLKIDEIIEIKIPLVDNGKISYKTEKVRIAGFLNREWTSNNYYGKAISIVMPIEKLSEVTNINDVNVLGIKTANGKEKEVESKIEKTLSNKNYNKLNSIEKLNNINMKEQENRKMQSMFLLLLMSIVASLNIYYTIKTGILIRTKEISTLRSIGMSMKKINNMLIKESLIYAFFSCILGAVHATYRQYKFASMVNQIKADMFGVEGLEKLDVPFNEILIFIFLVVVVCVISVYLSKHKLEKMSISEGMSINE